MEAGLRRRRRGEEEGGFNLTCDLTEHMNTPREETGRTRRQKMQ